MLSIMSPEVILVQQTPMLVYDWASNLNTMTTKVTSVGVASAVATTSKKVSLSSSAVKLSSSFTKYGCVVSEMTSANTSGSKK